MIRKWLSKRLYIKYSIKKIIRYFYVLKMEKLSIDEIMKFDAEMFEEVHGYQLDWGNLRTYSEKMQWEKIFHNYPYKD